MAADEKTQDQSVSRSDARVVAWQTAVLGAAGLTIASVVVHNAAICSSFSGWFLLSALMAPFLLLVSLIGLAAADARKSYQRLALAGFVVVAVLYLPYFVYVFVGGGFLAGSCY